MRIFFAILGLSLAAGSALTYQRGAIPLTVELDNANPYRWAERGEALADKGDIAHSKAAFNRAVALAPNIPFIWLRQANSDLMIGDQGASLISAARVLKTVPNYDDILFSYPFDPPAVLAAIQDDPRAKRSFLQHLIQAGDLANARLVWKQVTPDDKLTIQYVDFLRSQKQYQEALSTWTSYLGPRRHGDLIANPNFETGPIEGSSLDWHISSQPGLFETGPGTIHFLGKDNVNFDHLSQIVILRSAGSYHLSFRVKSSDITTNEGVRVSIPELGIETPPITESNPWTPMSLDFSVPAPRQIRIAVVRHPSQKFDNKISGYFWITGFSLTRSPNS